MAHEFRPDRDGASLASSVVVCHLCDQLQRRVVVRSGRAAHCCRCKAELYRSRENQICIPIALAVASLGLLFLTYYFPIIELEANGETRVATLFAAAGALFSQGFALLGIAVFLSTVVVPTVQVLAVLYVFVPLHFGHRAPWTSAVFRVVHMLHPWGMVEIFMLGTLVALVKLSSFAEIIVGRGFWSCAALMVLLAAMNSAINPGQFWSWVERGVAGK